MRTLPLQGGGAANLHLPFLPCLAFSSALPLFRVSSQHNSTAQHNKCCKGEVHRIVCESEKAFPVALKFSLFVGLLLVGCCSKTWTCQRPHFAPRYDSFIQGMADISATLTVGLKCFGTFSHGPESRLVFRAKEAETMFESALQLALLSRIYLSSGIDTTALCTRFRLLHWQNWLLKQRELCEIVMFTNVLSSK